MIVPDGWRLDDKRRPLLDIDKLGTRPKTPLTSEEHAKNNLPDVLAHWQHREPTNATIPAPRKSFTVPKDEIAATGYDLSLNRYKEVVHEQIDHIPSAQLIAELKQLDSEIQSGLVELAEMLK